MSSLWNFTVFFSCMVLLMVPYGHGSQIINGKEVKPHSLPYMALLQSNAPKCGGTLIHPSWVLTAAHCGTVRTVLLGVHSIKAKETRSRQILKVERQFPHPKYNKKTHANDLMLLKLKKPARQTKTVKPLKLPKTSRDPAAGGRCLVAGWGTTNYKVNKLSDVLMSANVFVISRAKCNSRDYYNRKPVITSSMVCAGSDGRKVADTCQGDSGGPLLCNGVQVGVTSFGVKCGLIKKPGVYAFLSDTQLQWIKKITRTSEM